MRVGDRFTVTSYLVNGGDDTNNCFHGGYFIGDEGVITNTETHYGNSVEVRFDTGTREGYVVRVEEITLCRKRDAELLFT